MTTEQGNKLIAEFMGKSTKKVWADCVLITETGKKLGGLVDPSFYYHSSWDWLMPVLEKIRNDHFVNIEMYGDYTFVRITKDKDLPNNKRQIRSEHKQTITAIYGATIQFIQWYNSQTPKRSK